MSESDMRRRAVADLWTLAGLAAVGAAFGIGSASGAAAQRVNGPPMLNHGVAVLDVDLEEFFWRCDYAATAGTITASQFAPCSAIAEDLKWQRFGGDFERMLDWWIENKLRQRQRLERLKQ